MSTYPPPRGGASACPQNGPVKASCAAPGHQCHAPSLPLPPTAPYPPSLSTLSAFAQRPIRFPPAPYPLPTSALSAFAQRPIRFTQRPRGEGYLARSRGRPPTGPSPRMRGPRSDAGAPVRDAPAQPHVCGGYVLSYR
jgi:hypothetical protein